MQKFIHHGLVIPIDENNVDTDKIIPAKHLTTVTKKGLGQYLFDDVRKENSKAYPLDSQKYQQASIMLCRPNFGCGSSREHAAWAIKDAGFQVLLGSTFMDIFINNCQLNGIWVIRLSAVTIDHLFSRAQKQNLSLSINIKKQHIRFPWGEMAHFKIDPFYKKIFMAGLDPLAWIMKNHLNKIQKFAEKSER